MAATLHRLRPATLDKAAEAIQLVLGLGLEPEVRRGLERLAAGRSTKPWMYVMLGREDHERIQREVLKRPRSGTTLAVWNACLIRSDEWTGDVRCSRADLADLAGTTAQEVSRAMSLLASLGALYRVKPGLYSLHPQAAHSGPLAARERKLELVGSPA